MQGGEEIVRTPPLVLVHREPCRLIDQQDVFILVEQGKRDAHRGKKCTVTTVAGKKLLSQKKLEDIPLKEDLPDLGTAAVHLDLFRPDRFIKERMGKVGQGLGDKFVKPLSCIVLPDMDLTHRDPLPS